MNPGRDQFQLYALTRGRFVADDSPNDRYFHDTALEKLPTSCNDLMLESAKIRNDTGGVYDIYIPPGIGWTEVYCDLTTDDGDWIVSHSQVTTKKSGCLTVTAEVNSG